MCFCVLLLVDMSYLYEHMILSFMAVLFSLSMAYVIDYNSEFFLCMDGWHVTHFISYMPLYMHVYLFSCFYDICMC